MQNKKKKVAIAAAALALVGLIGVGGAYAYFSGQSKVVENQFSYVAGEQDKDGIITIVEPEWNPEDAKDLEPAEQLTKDPYVHSDAEYEAFVAMKVVMPKIDGEVAEGVDTTEAFINLDWNTTDYTLLAKEDTADAVVYYYGYNTKLAAKSDTSKLFTTMEFNKFTKIAEAGSDSVDVSAAVIQSIDPDTGDEFTDIATAWSKYLSKALGYEAVADAQAE